MASKAAIVPLCAILMLDLGACGMSARAEPSRHAPPVAHAERARAWNATPALPVTREPVDLAKMFGSYQSRDALWVPGQLVAVNRDYDYQLAAVGDAGPALALVRRRTANRALVRELLEMQVEPITPDWLAATLARHFKARKLPAGLEQLRVYGLLFGERSARLQVIAEWGHDEQSQSVGAVSEAWPVKKYTQRRALRHAFGEALEAIAAVIAEGPQLATTAHLETRCAVGGRAWVDGILLSQSAKAQGRAVVAVKNRPSMRVSCPRESLSDAVP
jgi:hypothetical protein